ncbi:extracellular solute-binding protein [Pseudooceanicola sp. CBS1P-1]|uniref:Extracellular solute-binding protein n=1 Tax=Pseudooceanicola albus TaxID=2692189 RepID=A0A6L7G5Z9_9RHOB|nr:MULTISPECIES: extracellular solute-binding protein [Pseudooceanicola]MBT9385381.1 extracellular solute-binding protein [Pseudooceanicola endophyticus]MXN18760.1 extracellular solute-binding protein [Pseudooceanicola albus]
MTKTKDTNGTVLAGAAARRFNRRTLLGTALAAGVGTAVSPLYVRRAFASSGELNILCWSDELPDEVLSGFKEATGITVNKTPFSSNEEAINKMQATFGEGFDLVMPSFNRASEFQYIEVLKPFDEARLNLSAYEPSILKASQKIWTWDGLYHVPHVWGTEGMAWNTSTGLDYSKSSYGLLWEPEYAGKAQLRPTSGLLGLGLWLDATGKLPSNRMLDCYKDPDTMRKIYEEIYAFAVGKKANFKQFWDSADSIRAGFTQNGCLVGQTWDGPVKSMAKAGEPVAFVAPQEGALTWMDGFALSAAARNTDEVYAFFDYILKPETAGKICSLGGYNPSVKGASDFLSAEDKTLFTQAYPEDALDKLWWYPASPEWFNPIRNEYAERFKVA